MALTTPLYDRLLGRRIPGLGIADHGRGDRAGRVRSRNVIGKRLLQRGEGWLLRVPVFRTIYSPVKQLVAAFSPDNESGFKRVVMVEDPRRGLRARFSDAGVHRRSGPRPRAAAGGVRADQPSLSRRRRDLRARTGVVSRTSPSRKASGFS